MKKRGQKVFFYQFKEVEIKNGKKVQASLERLLYSWKVKG